MDEKRERDEIEFATITQFDDLDSVRGFAGEDYTKAVIARRGRITDALR